MIRLTSSGGLAGSAMALALLLLGGQVASAAMGIPPFVAPEVTGPASSASPRPPATKKRATPPTSAQGGQPATGSPDRAKGTAPAPGNRATVSASRVPAGDASTPVGAAGSTGRPQPGIADQDALAPPATPPPADPADAATTPLASRAVAVVRVGAAHGPTHELATRIVGELMAENALVIALTCSVGDAQCLAVAVTRAEAAVLVGGGEAPRAVEVRAGARAGARSGASGSARVVGDTADVTTATLAVRTVEVVRAMLAATSPSEPGSPLTGRPVAMTSAVGDAPAPAETTARSTRDGKATDDDDDGDQGGAGATGARGASGEASSDPRPIIASLGAAFVSSMDGLGTAYGPSLRIGRAMTDRLSIWVVAAGPAFTRDFVTSSGSVSVRQEMALFEMDVRLGRRALSGRVGAGIGFYHLQAEGKGAGVSPIDGTFFIGRSDGVFSLALSSSATAVLKLDTDIALFADARLIWLTPTPVVAAQDFEVGRTGSPCLLFTAGVELGF